MITAWRLVKDKHAAEAFTGFAARTVSGRWHHEGTPIVYLADSLALAALEVFVHLPAGTLAISFSAFKVEIPDEVSIQIARNPRNWRETPAPESTRTVGTRWFHAMETALMRVPSVIVPEEHNYLINLKHPDFKKLTIHRASPFSFDPRMWK